MTEFCFDKNKNKNKDEEKKANLVQIFLGYGIGTASAILCSASYTQTFSQTFRGYAFLK